MLKNVSDYWFAWIFFITAYFWGFGFWFVFGSIFLILRFFRKRPSLWWLSLFLFAINLALFRILWLLFLFSSLFYFFTEKKYFSKPGNQDRYGITLSWPLVLAFFILTFDLYFISSNLRFALGAAWFFFLMLSFLLWRFSLGMTGVVSGLILSFVFSEVFFVLFFFPFGNIVNAGVMTLMFLAVTDYWKDSSFKRFLFFLIPATLLVLMAGVKPR